MKRFKIIGLCLVAAFALSAAMASGASATNLYGTCLTGTPVTKPPCGAGEHFTPFSASGEMVVSHGTTPFVLASVATPVKGIECKKLEDMGIFSNMGENGFSTDELIFKECTPNNLSGCTEINPKMNHEILGSITDEVIEEGSEVMITVGPGQFNVKCVIAGEEVELGGVEGLTNGKIKGDTLVFSKSAGLKFFGNNSTITGTDLNETLNKMPVFVH